MMQAMRWLPLLLAACSSKSEPRVGSGSANVIEKAAPVTGPSMQALPSPLPPGPYVVRYHCFHSDAPAGTGSQTVERTVDLGAATLTAVDRFVGDDTKPPPPTAPKVVQLDAAAATALRTAVDKVVHGGPYRAEPADPEGTACYLAIGTSATTAFFQIDKSLTNERDAVSELVTLVHRTANR